MMMIRLVRIFATCLFLFRCIHSHIVPGAGCKASEPSLTQTKISFVSSSEPKTTYNCKTPGVLVGSLPLSSSIHITHPTIPKHSAPPLSYLDRSSRSSPSLIGNSILESSPFVPAPTSPTSAYRSSVDPEDNRLAIESWDCWIQ